MPCPDASPYLLALVAAVYRLSPTLARLRLIGTDCEVSLPWDLVTRWVAHNTGVVILRPADAIASHLARITDELLSPSLILLHRIIVCLLRLRALPIIASLEIDHVAGREVHIRNVAVVDDVLGGLGRHSSVRCHRVLLRCAVELKACGCLSAGELALVDASTCLRLSYHADGG